VTIITILAVLVPVHAEKGSPLHLHATSPTTSPATVLLHIREVMIHDGLNGNHRTSREGRLVHEGNRRHRFGSTERGITEWLRGRRVGRRRGQGLPRKLHREGRMGILTVLHVAGTRLDPVLTHRSLSTSINRLKVLTRGLPCLCRSQRRTSSTCCLLLYT